MPVDTLALQISAPGAAAGLALFGLPEDAQTAALLRVVGTRAGDPHTGAAFLDVLLPALAQCPDPEAGLRHLEFWSSHLPTPASTLAALKQHPRLLADLLHLLSLGVYFTGTLVREPGLYAVLLEDEGARPWLVPKTFERAVESALRPLRQASSRRDALRRARHRETLRIAWRELTGRTTPREATREFSELADALLGAAGRLAHEEFPLRYPSPVPPPRIAVIAMGKLGGCELNYSSDVDLLLVADGPEPGDERALRAAQRWGELFIAILTEQTGEGHVFRVDMRLRPEGRFGSLVRSLDSFRAYFDRWVETWERQALLKARFVAGDPTVGSRFVALAQAVAFARGQSPTVREEVRDMRLAVERRLEAAGEIEMNVKEGRGTIRDIEFTVQLLQLLFGGERPELRAANTWEALGRLAEADLLAPEEARTLHAGYDFFRTLEHRLQLSEDLPVRLLPASEGEQYRLARSMGYPTAAVLLADYRKQAAAVRAVADAIYARLGFPGEDGADRLPGLILALDAPAAAERVAQILADRGFHNPEDAAAMLRWLAFGPSDSHTASTRRAFAELSPTLIEACAASPDPDAALAGFQRLADVKGLHRTFYRSYLERPGPLAALCRILGGAPGLSAVMTRQPELLEAALAESSAEAVDTTTTPGTLVAALRQRLATVHGDAHRTDALRRFKRRELVRVVAHDLLCEPAPEQILAEWSDVAEACLQGALELAVDGARREGHRVAGEASGFAVLALGRLGGRELHYASDLDLVYICRPATGGPAYRQYEALAQRFHEIIQATTREGALFAIDLRLRPEGKRGAFITHVDTCRDYFRERAETWEKQAWIKARGIAGDAALAWELLADLAPLIYPSEPSEEWRRSIARLKRRMERERCRPEERDRHLKLGPGGLSDVEFVVQWLQLRHGSANPPVQVANTFLALAALRAHGLLTEKEHTVLRDGYSFLVALRQRLTLRDLTASADLLPTDLRDLNCLARAVGLQGADALRERLCVVRAAIREVFESYLGVERGKE
ncbi:MAG: hypothetical protein HY320_01915 [Armatimonadetes bacterium]|nr:hypothetical protein [Armatimonadota bacterium]